MYSLYSTELSSTRLPNEFLEEKAFAQLRTLLKEYPDAIPVLKSAIVEGRVARGRYVETDGKGTMIGGCLLGLISSAYEDTVGRTRFGICQSNSVLGRIALRGNDIIHYVDYGSDIAWGRTPETSVSLARLLTVVEEVEQDVSHRLFYEEVRQHTVEEKWHVVPSPVNWFFDYAPLQTFAEEHLVEEENELALCAV